MTSEIRYVALEELRPHPDNPRLVYRQDVIDNVASQIEAAGEFPLRHALTVRPLDGYYQIVSGHHRAEAARKAGLDKAPCWVVDVTDQEAFMELVLGNSQGELCPLEYGIHALKAAPLGEGGRGKIGGLSEYAKRVGKSQPYLTLLRQAATVYEAVKPISQLIGFDLSDKAMHLAEIHRAERSLWPILVEFMLQRKWSVVNARYWVGRALEFDVPEKWQAIFLPLPEVVRRFLDAPDFSPSAARTLVEMAEATESLIADCERLLGTTPEEYHRWLSRGQGGYAWEVRRLLKYERELRARLSSQGENEKRAEPGGLIARQKKVERKKRGDEPAASFDVDGRDSLKPFRASRDTPPSTSASHVVSRLYFSAGGVRIYHADVLNAPQLQDSSIDLIVTSPPYNVGVAYGEHNDEMPYPDYLAWTKEWLRRCQRWLKADGRLCLNLPLDKNKGGQQSVYADVLTIAKRLGWRYHTTIIWNEQNVSRRTAWGSWANVSAPYVITPVEVIAVLYKDTWKKSKGGPLSITESEFIEWTNGMWTFSGESKNRVGHPAPFPIELPRRCLKLFSYVNDTVLDPFLGSGTTLLACAETNREGIGLEINERYCQIARQRLVEKHRLSEEERVEPEESV